MLSDMLEPTIQSLEAQLPGTASLRRALAREAKPAPPDCDELPGLEDA